MRGGGDRVEFTTFEDAVQTRYLNIGGRMVVNLGAGGDEFLFEVDLPLANASVEGSTIIKGGAGSDNILLSQVEFGDRLDVRTGGIGALDAGVIVPAETLSANDVSTEGPVFLRGGSNTQILTINGLEVNSNLSITTGGNTDRVMVSEYFVDGNVRIDVGRANSVIEEIQLGHSNVVGDLTVRGSGGDHSVELGMGNGDIYIDGNTNIALGSGNDRVILPDDTYVRFGLNFQSSLGGGDDYVEIGARSEFAQDLNVSLGAGDDTIQFNFIAFDPPTVMGQAFLRGGSGFDEAITLDYLLITNGDAAALSSFELVNAP